MQLNITQKNEQPLLARIEIKGMLEGFETTPSNKEVQKAIASSLKSAADCVVVQKIQGVFGKKQASVVAHVYKDVETRNKVELPLGKKGKEKAEKIKAKETKAAEQPAQ